MFIFMLYLMSTKRCTILKAIALKAGCRKKKAKMVEAWRAIHKDELNEAWRAWSENGSFL
jgi:hypothetical protein